MATWPRQGWKAPERLIHAEEWIIPSRERIIDFRQSLAHSPEWLVRSLERVVR